MNQITNHINIIKTDNIVSSKESIRNVALVLLIIISILIISLAAKDSNTFYNDTFIYTLLISFFIFAFFAYSIYTFDEASKKYILLFLITVTLLIVILVITFKSGLSSFLANDYLMNFYLLSIIFFALIIIYVLFLEKYVHRQGWTSFIIKFIFYIPCEFTNGIKYLLQEFYSTKSYVFYLLFIEFILITIYFYFYPRLQNSVYDNGIILLKYPKELNREVRIDLDLYRSFFNKKSLPGSKIEIKSPIRTTYSLSMWIYLNNQPFSQYAYKKETTIFEYSDSSGNGHPKITYKNNEKGLDRYTFYLSPTTNHSLVLPNQKWNNIVLNYRDLNVDIFINGNLEINVKLNEMPTYTNTDKISIGEDGVNERTGLYGSICNIVYYKNIMTKGQIIDNYNLLNIRNPPIN